MKTYIFTKKLTKGTYGYNFKLNIFRVKNNVPEYVCTRKGSCGTMRGYTSEVFNALLNCGEIPKSYYNLSVNDWQGAGYYCAAVRKKGIQIIELIAPLKA